MSYLVDVGFGGAGAPRLPIPLHDGSHIVDPASGDAYRLVAHRPVEGTSTSMSKWGIPAFLISESAASGELIPAHSTTPVPDYILYVSPAHKPHWIPTYHFSTCSALPASDAELANHFCDTSILSVIGSRLMVSIMTPTGRKTLLDDVYSEVSPSGRTKRILEGKGERMVVLRDEFGVHV
ncbi:hypothetical protein DFS34DRAFT_631930 [Phlyctochytrium arcticum]|nr:hypothetical protein DFS34DRAFT_631930 [Phlyctochytrium arcticum]